MTTLAEKLEDALDALDALQKDGLLVIDTDVIITVYRQGIFKE